MAIDELWYGAEEATAIATALVPRLSKARDKLVRLLREVVVIKRLLEEDTV